MWPSSKVFSGRCFPRRRSCFPSGTALMNGLCRPSYAVGSRLRIFHGNIIQSRAHGRHTSTQSSKQTARKSSWRGAAIAFTIGSVFGAGFYFLNDGPTNTYSAGGFHQYKLVSKVSYSSTSSLFTLVPNRHQGALEPWKNAWETGLSSIEIKQPQLQISRAYTPLPRLLGDIPGFVEDDALQLWIRREVNGEVSNYLHNLPVGATIDLRGPKKQYEIPNGVGEVLFLAGGTGIVPALQLTQSLLNDRAKSDTLPKLSILWANRRREDCLGGTSDTRKVAGLCSWFRSDSTHERPASKAQKSPIVQDLDSLKVEFQGKLEVDYFVDEEGTFITKEALLQMLAKPSRTTVEPTSGCQRLVLVCGPDGFVNHFAGPKQWHNKQEVRGELGGVLKETKGLGWDVWKL